MKKRVKIAKLIRDMEIKSYLTRNHQGNWFSPHLIFIIVVIVTKLSCSHQCYPNSSSDSTGVLWVPLTFIMQQCRSRAKGSVQTGPRLVRYQAVGSRLAGNQDVSVVLISEILTRLFLNTYKLT